MSILYQLLSPIISLLPLMLLLLPLVIVVSAIVFLSKKDRAAWIWVAGLMLCISVVVVCALGFTFVIGSFARHGGPDNMTLGVVAMAFFDSIFDRSAILRPMSSGFALFTYLGSLLAYVWLGLVWWFHRQRRRQ
jgi:hypothetical protein